MCIAGNPLLTEDPMVGAVTPGSAKVWTRTSSPALVTVQYSVDPNMQDDVSETSVIITASASDYTAIFSLTGLVPSTTYSYRVVANGQAQLPPFPSFRTAPAAGSSEDFGFVVFADLVNIRAYPNDPAPAYFAAASEAPAFFVQIGDFDHRNPQTIKEMRRMHRDVRSRLTAAGRDLSEAILPWFPVYHVWDDHDYGTNNGDKTFAGKAAALQAFKEYYPTPDLANPAAGIWHKFSYAQAEIFMLDLRSQRDEPGDDPEEPGKSILEGDPIARGQKQWLKTGLLTSTARWKIVMSSVPFNRRTKPLDSWGAFLAERREILNFLCTNRITGVVMISGDIHSGGGIDDGTNSGVPELSVPHTNERGGNTGVLGTWSEGIVSGLGNPGYGSIQVLTNPDRVILQAKGEDGAVRKSLTVFPTTARCQ
jgi:alkaline phosphatase D